MNQRMAYLRFASRVFYVFAIVGFIVGMGLAVLSLLPQTVITSIDTPTMSSVTRSVQVSFQVWAFIVPFMILFVNYTIARLLWYLTDLGNLLQLVNAKLDHTNGGFTIAPQLRPIREHQPAVKIPAVPPLN
jgi:hypothetical protein